LEIDDYSKFNGNPGSKIDRLTSQHVNHEVGCVQKRKFLSAMEELKTKIEGKMEKNEESVKIEAE
jgi:hypothetical protein